MTLPLRRSVGTLLTSCLHIWLMLPAEFSSHQRKIQIDQIQPGLLQQANLESLSVPDQHAAKHNDAITSPQLQTFGGLQMAALARAMRGAADG